MGDYLPVTRVICRFNAADARKEMLIMMADMFDQLCLCFARPGDENLAGIGDGLGNDMQEARILAPILFLS